MAEASADRRPSSHLLFQQPNVADPAGERYQWKVLLDWKGNCAQSQFLKAVPGRESNCMAD
jgi:hypothetical protein